MEIEEYSTQSKLEKVNQQSQVILILKRKDQAKSVLSTLLEGITDSKPEVRSSAHSTGHNLNIKA